MRVDDDGALVPADAARAEAPEDPDATP